MRRAHRILATALALAPAAVLAQALGSNAPVEFSLPGNGLVNSIYIDVPAGAGALRVEVDALTAGRDVDLLLRRGSPLQAGTPADPQALFDQAQYRSASSTGQEFVTISKAGVRPLAAGRWYVAVLNFSAAATDVRVRATLLDSVPVVPIEMVYDSTANGCNTAPWNAERRAAMDHAAALLTEQLKPRAPVRVQACWEDLPEGTLANAGPQFIFAHDVGAVANLPFLPQPYSFYSSAATTHNAGTDLCRFAGGACDDFDIRANFNTDGSFYYGTDGASTGAQADFVATAMHEITHGLGFYALLDTATGERDWFYGDAYINQVRWHQNGADAPRPLLELTEAERVEAVTSRFLLRFEGENARLANGGLGIRLYAPFPPRPGSSLSHLDSTMYGAELMSHIIPRPAPHDLGIAVPILYDVGWDPAPKAQPAFELPASGQYFDPRRGGHGIAMYRVAGLQDFYFVVFYTYDDAGVPEFYVANGYVVDGVFVPERNAHGDSLIRSLYDPGQQPPTVHDASAGFNGQLRIDFNHAAASPVCANGNDVMADAAAVMSFTLPGSNNQQWCLLPIMQNPDVQQDLTNIWLDPADGGWGASSLSFPGNGGDGLGMQVYYPDAQGQPRWAIMQTDNYQVGGSYPLMQAKGFCRTCTATPTEFEQVGTVTVGLRDGADAAAANALDFSVEFLGAAGGTFSRDSAVIPGGVPNGD